MMRYLIWIATFAISSLSQNAFSLDKLPEKYLATYGDPDAPTKIVEYFSFQCPHCLALFRQDFQKIKETYIDSKKVFWIFHPIPTDLVTVQGMVCMAALNDRERKLFIETLLDEGESSNPHLTALIMSKVMEIFEKPISDLQDENFLEKTDAFLDAFNFLTQEQKILAVPTIEVDSRLFPKDVPDFEFVQNVVNQ